MNIKVCDAPMGAGKTSAAIKAKTKNWLLSTYIGKSAKNPRK